MAIRILIADDNEAVRGRLGELLATHDGWEVCGSVASGREAVEKAVELRPSLIILDLAMPEMDGLSAAKEIGKVTAVGSHRDIHASQICDDRS